MAGGTNFDTDLKFDLEFFRFCGNISSYYIPGYLDKIYKKEEEHHEKEKFSKASDFEQKNSRQPECRPIRPIKGGQYRGH